MRTKNKLALLFFLLLVTVATKKPELFFQRSEVQEMRKAQIYLQRTLLRYERGRQDKYTLYLAVRNYASRLGFLEQDALRQMEKKDPSSYNRLTRMSFFIGEDRDPYNSIAKVGKKTLYDTHQHYLYFKRWRIDLDHLLLIQDNPQEVIIRKKIGHN